MLIRKVTLFIFLISILFSCNSVKYLQPNEIILKQNKIKINNHSSDEANFRLKDQLIPLQKQKPNRNFLLIFPREWIYFQAQKRKNKDAWYTKTLQKQSEPPALLDSNSCEITRKNFNNYLYNLGYFKVETDYIIQLNKQKAKVIYICKPGPRYVINDIEYSAEDTTIQKLIEAEKENSLLIPGSPLDYNLFQNEKARLSDLLYNHGYIDFSPIYIDPFLADTIHHKANLRLNIRNPNHKPYHSKFTIQQVRVNQNYLPTERSAVKTTFQFDSLEFTTDDSKPFVIDKLLARKIKIRPGQIANKSLIDETYSSLFKLGTYRFISIEGKVDSNSLDQIQYNILLSPNKQWVFDFGADLNYTSIKQARKTLFGLSGFIHLKNRNLFHRAASLSTKLEVGTELDLLQFKNFNSLNIRYSNELSLPSFYDFTKSWSIFNFAARLLKKNVPAPDSRTNIEIGIDYENLVNLYNYTAVNSGILYDWQFKRRQRFSLRTLGFSIYIPQTTASFDSLLIYNKFLRESFTNSRLFSSVFMDNITMYLQSKQKGSVQHSLIASLNLSGLEVNAINSLYNSLTGKTSKFAIGEFEFSKFIKTDLDYRVYFSYSDKSKLACRIATGIIRPFGNSSSVPYIKQFYVGGPQSVRAWNLREIGPGSLNLSDSVDANNPTYFSAGDFKLEGNIEYRFDMFWRLKGAIFMDAGNIWYIPGKSTISEEPGFLNANFLKEIAIGTGLGVRLDLTYFLFRVDVGFQLKNAYPDTNGSYWIYNKNKTVSLSNLFENSTIHLALDYPF